MSWTYNTLGRLYRPAPRHRSSGCSRYGVGDDHRRQLAARSRRSRRPDASLTWKVGDTITFSGGATDAQDGTEPASRLRWTLLLHHCSSPTDCHVHTVQSFAGVASGSFAVPDHGYPVYLELQLTATDAGGLAATTSVRLDPRTVDLTFRSNPGGLKVTITSADSTLATPFTHTYVVNSRVHAHRPADDGCQGGPDLHVPVVVRRWSRRPHHHRSSDRDDLHGDVSQTLTGPTT